MKMKCFLEIEIGHPQEWRSTQDQYERAKEFLQKEGSNYGFPETLEELSDEQKELFDEMYNSNPSWKAKGSYLLIEPTPLKVGRIVIELFDKDVSLLNCVHFIIDRRQRLVKISKLYAQEKKEKEKRVGR
eukprot:TRINITY_DN7665_c0_g1_i1.p1 TRINITY_DN7665_c0_g1~~TRINITY_DN7665_c0_g1_i1.p1  ORF type:complete len:130 (+),score=28.75 TRINITY_DN7665_c0_g1_i1:97-486(+)